MDQLREFLSRVLPWPDDSQSHFCNLHWCVKGQSRTFWSGRACRDVEDMVRTLRWAEKFPDTRDIYVCMSAQSAAEPKTSKSGHQYLSAVRNQENAVALKSLFLDIDCKGDGKGYPDQKTAITALLHFCGETALPRPTLVVSSGGGIHAHWVLDRALSPADWRPLAEALAEATRQKELLCDVGVTIDSARILRPPLTKNFKSDPPKDTRLIGTTVPNDYAVEDIAKALAPFITAKVTPSQGLHLEGEAPAALQGIDAPDVTTNLTIAHRVDLDLVAAECPFIKEAIDTGGAAFDQPLWNLTTLIATFTQLERDDAHRMAMGHADYTEESTDALYDRKLREKQEKDFGWPSCGAILNAGCSSCRTCPHLKEGKSPLNFEKRKFVPNNPLHLPKGYHLNSDNHICTYAEDESGQKKQLVLVDYEVSDVWAQKDPWVLHFSAILHDNKKSKVEVLAGQMMAADTLKKALGEQGVMVSPWVTKHLPEFFVSWVKTLQARKDSVVDSAPFGWNTSDGQVDGFCFGGEVWTPSGSRPAPNVDHVLRRQYAPTGSRKPWDDALTLVTGQGRPELEAIVASAFASPLVKATGWYGAFLSAYSQESGIGKTTAMKIAQAVWGDPVTAMQGLTDTLNSVTRKIGAIRSLPLYWDEIKGDEDTRKFVRLAFQMTSGKDKSRLGRDSALKEVGKWQTMLVSSTNETLVEYIAQMTTGTTAGLYRLFEFQVAPMKMARTIDTGEAQRMLGRLDDNYGVVGFEYAQWLGQNFARIDTEVGEYMRRIEKAWGFRQDERFWQCAITCTVMGARYANELGFTQFDVDAIEAFLKKTLDRMRETVKDSTVDLTNPDNVADVLTQFFKAMKRHTLVTNKIPQGAGRPKGIQVVRIHPNHDGTHVHVGKEDMTIRISSRHLSVWLDKNTNVSRKLLLNEFEKRWGTRRVLGHLGSGTDYVEGKEWLIEILAAGTPLAQFIDEAGTDGAGDANGKGKS